MRPDHQSGVRSTAGRTGERGFTLAALLVILTLMAIVIAYTIPKMWSNVMRRERDIQAIWVMKQYARAIAEFQRKRGALPTSLDQLKEQADPRVLRSLYADPLTGKDDWVLVSPAEVQQQPAPGAPGAPVPPPPPQRRPTGEGMQVGPFVGVRPPVTGQAFVALNGLDQYEQWQYTVFDLQKEQGGPQQGAVPFQSIPSPPPPPKPKP